MGGLGSGSFGSVAFGSGGGAYLAGAEQLTRNTVRVRLGGLFTIDNPGMVTDATYSRNYTLATYNTPSAHVPFVVWAQRESETSVVLYLDAELDGPGVLYRVVADPRLVGAGSPEARSVLFHTFGEHRAAAAARGADRTLDLAENLPIDTDGDYRGDMGLENLKKRILRRLSTRRGAFAHAPEYGLQYEIKRNVTVGLLRDLQAQAFEQVRAEPGVRSVRVTVSTPVPGLVRLKLEVDAQRVSGTGSTANVVSFELEQDLAFEGA